MIYIIAIHLSGGANHEHITHLRWHDPQTGKTDVSTREEIIDWIDNRGGDARVQDRHGEVQVGVVRARPPYLRTFADRRPTDNLLWLPQF